MPPDPMAERLQVLIRSKYCLLAVISKEERRIEAIIRSVGQSLPDKDTNTPFAVRYWSCTQGVTQNDENGIETAVDANVLEPDEILTHIRDTAERCIYVLRDFHPYLAEGYSDTIRVRRRLRELRRFLRGRKPAEARAVILLSPTLKIPAELEGELHLVEWPLPERKDLAVVLDETLKGIQDAKIKAAAEAVDRDRIINAAVGLTTEQAYTSLARSLVSRKTIDPQQIAEEKKALLGEDGVLEVLEPLPDGLAGVGGLDVLKAFIQERKMAFSPAARAYGLDPQKGVFIGGVPGAGKTYAFRGIAGEYGLFAVRFVVANLFGSLLGESEAKFRLAKKRLKILAPVAVLFDEIDKAIAGGDRDGGTADRIKGEFLTFLQEETDPEVPIYKVATANNLESIVMFSPELVRAGRWDKLFFIDLPLVEDREAVLKIHIAKRRHEKPANFGLIDTKRVAIAAVDFCGGELENVVSAAMFRGYLEARPTTTEDMLAVVATEKPLAKTARDRIDALRKFAKDRFINASSVAAGDREERHGLAEM